MTTYAAVGIVKDEAETIGPCLDSLRPLISSWTFVDTGSTDATGDVIKATLGDIPGRLFHLEFKGFGHSRTEAFAAAAGTADWLVATDADMTWEIDPDFEPDPAVDAYLISMGTSDFAYRLPLLLNGRRSWKSVGAVHEYTVLSDGSLGRREPTDKVRVVHHGDGRSSPEKTRWHVSLLEAELAEHPDDPRTVFYLAQSYRELGDNEAALRRYAKRAAMGGFEEERWYAQYRGALLTDWPARIEALMAAWEARPQRLEPLHALVQELNQRDLHRAVYALTESYPLAPGGDILFVHRSVWDWGMDFERAIAAYWVGEYAESRRLNEALLTRDLPDHIRGAVLRNLAFVAERAA